MLRSFLKEPSQSWAKIERSLLPARVWESDRLTIWRERVVLVLSLLSAYLGPFALIPSSILAYVEDRWNVIIIDLVAYLTALAIYHGRQRPLKYRAWAIYLMVYVLGAGLLLMLGPQGAGYIWLFAASVLAGALLGLRTALVTLALNLAFLLAVAFLLTLGVLPWAASMTNPLQVWLVMVINFMLLNTLVTVTTALMLGGLESALEKELRASVGLRQSEARFRSLSENAPDAIFTLDPEGRFSYANPYMTATLGYAPAELTSLSLADLAPEGLAPRLAEAVEEVTRAGKSVHGAEIQLAHRDGRTLRFLLGGAPQGGAEGGPYGMIGVLKDITEQTQLAQQLQQAQKMEALGILAGGIAHDFNNILGVVMGYTELAQELSGLGQPNAAELEQVLQAALRARNLVKQILAFSRKAEAELQPLSPNQAVRGVVEILRRTLPKMIDIERRLASDLPLVKADANQMEQVLLNLANNAADAMPDGGRLVFETKAVSLDNGLSSLHGQIPPGRYVLLTVSDSGQGIAPQTLEYIFDPFFTTKEVGKGTGLGLATVYGIVKSHGGFIHCQSQPGQGATFNIYLPIMTEEMASEPTPEAVVNEAALKGSETVLLTDDEEALRAAAARMLREAGYRVLEASSGEEAVEAFNQSSVPPDLVVMDLGMPGMGGHKAMLELIARRPGVKVVIASGYGAQARVRDALDAGAASYVAKPFQRVEMLTIIRRVLDRP